MSRMGWWLVAQVAAYACLQGAIRFGVRQRKICMLVLAFAGIALSFSASVTVLVLQIIEWTS